jgi:HEAT repeat protein
MNKRQTIVYRAVKWLSGGTVVWAILLSRPAPATGPDDGPPRQPPTWRTIPDDAPLELQTLMEKMLLGFPWQKVQTIGTVNDMGPRAAPVVPYLIKNLGNPNPVTVGDMAYWALRDLGKCAVEPLIAALAVEAYDKDTRGQIIGLLGETGDRRAVPALISALNDESAEVRANAADALSQIPDARSVEPLIRLLSDKSDLAGRAIRALGESGDRRAVQPIISLLAARREKRLDVRLQEEAAIALGRLGAPEAFGVLLRLYRDARQPDEVLLRDAALEALGKTKDPRALDVLLPALHASIFPERDAAVRGLAGLGSASALAPLKRILKDDRPTPAWWSKVDNRSMLMIRQDAALALTGTGDDGAIDAVADEHQASLRIREWCERSPNDRFFRTAAADGLAMSPKPRAYLKVIDILEGNDPEMRCEVARVLYCSTISEDLSWADIPVFSWRKLAALDDPRVLRALMKVVESNPPSTQPGERYLRRHTRQFAVNALMKSGNPEALAFLKKFGGRVLMPPPFVITDPRFSATP